MAKYTDEYLNYVLEQLEELTSVSVRRMFGGYGLYSYGKIFAFIDEGELYFKADDESAQFYGMNGGVQFSYQKGGKIIYMRYFRVPAEVLEDLDLLKIWFEYASRASKEK